MSHLTLRKRRQISAGKNRKKKKKLITLGPRSSYTTKAKRGGGGHHLHVNIHGLSGPGGQAASETPHFPGPFSSPVARQHGLRHEDLSTLPSLCEPSPPPPGALESQPPPVPEQGPPHGASLSRQSPKGKLTSGEDAQQHDCICKILFIFVLMGEVQCQNIWFMSHANYSLGGGGLEAPGRTTERSMF